MYKKIFINILALIIVMGAISIVYERWFFESDLQKHSDIINLVRDIPADADIIYLGESSNITSHEQDIDKRPISAFIGDHFPDLNTYDITKPASHAGIYKVLLENIPKYSEVKTVIITLNLRSFNAQWIYSDLETPLQKSIVLIKDHPPLVNRFLLSFKAYDIKSDKERVKQVLSKWEKDILKFPYDFPFQNVIEWDTWMANTGIKDAVGNKDYAQTELACHYIKGYAFQIDTLNNPRIKDFNEIIELAESRGWNLVFNLMAENTEKANELVGDDLTFLMNENAELLVNYFTARGVTVVNNLYAVDNNQFIDQNWTTEHYAEDGRKIIAKNVADQIKKWYPKEFVEVEYEAGYQTLFFNNCDSNIIWGGMYSITDEMAYSGTLSSKTGGGNDFSITLEYPLKVIPANKKHKINFELMMYQTSLNHKGEVVLQANGQDFRFYWNSLSLVNKNSNIKEWLLYKNSMEIPDSIKNADLIKVYVHNPSSEILYIDDFRVSFE